MEIPHVDPHVALVSCCSKPQFGARMSGGTGPLLVDLEGRHEGRSECTSGRCVYRGNDARGGDVRALVVVDTRARTRTERTALEVGTNAPPTWR